MPDWAYVLMLIVIFVSALCVTIDWKLLARVYAGTPGRKYVRVPARVRLAKLEERVRALEAIADAAWRVREVLHLNLLALDAGLENPAAQNIAAAINDLNTHLPLCEDGRWWRAEDV